MDTQDSHVAKINKIRSIAGWLVFASAAVLLVIYAVVASWQQYASSADTLFLRVGLITLAVWFIVRRQSLFGGILAVAWGLLATSISFGHATDTSNVFVLLSALVLLIGGLLYISVGLMEHKEFFLSKEAGKYKSALNSFINRFKSKRWYLRNLLPFVSVFAVLALISFTAGMAPYSRPHIKIWNLNPYLWLGYGGADQMPWQSFTLKTSSESIVFSGSIPPFLITLFWWGFLSAIIVSVAKILLARIKRSTHKIEPVPGPSH